LLSLVYEFLKRAFTHVVLIIGPLWNGLAPLTSPKSYSNRYNAAACCREPPKDDQGDPGNAPGECDDSSRANEQRRIEYDPQPTINVGQG
jgi:hypothetical protein